MSIEPYFDDNGLCNDPWCSLCYPYRDDQEYFEEEIEEEDEL
jgi:hypothetical protein